jgi:hypothetical protein
MGHASLTSNPSVSFKNIPSRLNQRFPNAKIEFEVKEEALETGNGWSGPFALWVRDERAAHASDLLVPYFASRDKSD